ncbi:MAG TPA: hypothetical protein VKY92_10220 [Verrucomicrobiae bacterium]|nr:hypothetical protein [Verrucomicrobiae bacterium]
MAQPPNIRILLSLDPIFHLPALSPVVARCTSWRAFIRVRPLRQFDFVKVQGLGVEVQVNGKFVGARLGKIELPRAVPALFVVAAVVENKAQADALQLA